MPEDLWKEFNSSEYQEHVTISTIDSTTELKDADKRIVYIEDLEKRKQVYGICGECNEPGTGWKWCRPCNAKRLKDNFKNWTSGNKFIDEFIQQSQLNAVNYRNYIEWIPYEKFQNITYIAEGGFSKVYSAEWPEGHIEYWDIENQQWYRFRVKYALKSLNNSSDICSDFLSEIRSHLQIYLYDVVPCYGITQDPNSKEYMMVLKYCYEGNLRDCLNKAEIYIGYRLKINTLQQIARGLQDIHNSGLVHKDFHSGNILALYIDAPFISDLGLCQPVNKQRVKEEGIYGVVPYMAPEVLRRNQYTKAADIYSFGIVMNELLSEEIPFNDIPHDKFLAIKICSGLRPNISNNVPKLLAELIIKCWDAEIENRPTTKELYETLKKWDEEENNELSSQIEKCDEIRIKEFESRSNEDRTMIVKMHPQAIYTSRLLNFKNLPEPVNSSNLLSCQLNSADAKYAIQSTSTNPSNFGSIR
ncbi:hypothetical protein RclHR1_03160008 [Rhizophagus clarus]|uniref:Protein kinase domain-containing protein n=1 Tax=Rhizophagus clarus TaxID=94130 RepID=A0A2Z6S2G5_9GLOM|nr:hypothetical protein RclHR1_03160008 [Rhizophagus clarus]